MQRFAQESSNRIHQQQQTSTKKSIPERRCEHHHHHHHSKPTASNEAAAAASRSRIAISQQQQMITRSAPTTTRATTMKTSKPAKKKSATFSKVENFPSLQLLSYNHIIPLLIMALVARSLMSPQVSLASASGQGKFKVDTQIGSPSRRQLREIANFRHRRLARSSFSISRSLESYNLGRMFVNKRSLKAAAAVASQICCCIIIILRNQFGQLHLNC